MEKDVGDTVSLRALFNRLQNKYYKVQEESSSSLESQELISHLIQEYLGCQSLIYKLSIFSPNEELDDISTTNLK